MAMTNKFNFSITITAVSDENIKSPKENGFSDFILLNDRFQIISIRNHYNRIINLASDLLRSEAKFIQI
ncbi:hypothetical protein BpHYR1_012943 [Brachionus plicatilis]|uniref:Uncharacterized protein n=1 Tax=Brachionus plicatilis TaxID=10195 RepID=A0A3M7SPW4_BRAPC|nr:hypothetical protein BpHYR1_012943 [Brachionus plicatilis]